MSDSLLSELWALRQPMADHAVFGVLDNWEQNEAGWCEVQEFYGGACSHIATTLQDWIAEQRWDAAEAARGRGAKPRAPLEFALGKRLHPPHVWVVVVDRERREAVKIDVDPTLYEVYADGEWWQLLSHRVTVADLVIERVPFQIWERRLAVEAAAGWGSDLPATE